MKQYQFPNEKLLVLPAAFEGVSVVVVINIGSGSRSFSKASI
jgi:hypothetical protein